MVGGSENSLNTTSNETPVVFPESGRPPVATFGGKPLTSNTIAREVQIQNRQTFEDGKYDR